MDITSADLLDRPLDELLVEAVGEDHGPARLEPVDYVSGSPATGGLYRLRGLRDGGSAWSLFVKVVQHVRHWTLLPFLPPTTAERFLATFPWRDELLLWSDLTQSTLPDGLRSPVLHHVADLGEDRLAVWTEDVDHDGDAWDLPRYARAATLLGRWNARASAAHVLAASPHPVGHALRMYAEEAIASRGLAPLADDGLWEHPWLAPHADLRASLLALGPDIAAMLDRLDTYPQTMGHGDASPQNLLVPRDAPDTFVAIDISFTTPEPLGFDLGQLLVGLTHAGLMPAARLSEIAATILPAYLEGLRAEGLAPDPAGVRDAFATSVLVRSGFDAVPWEWLGDPARERDVTERLALARFLVEQYSRTRRA